MSADKKITHKTTQQTARQDTHQEAPGLWLGVQTLCWSMWKLHRWATIIAVAALIIACGRLIWTGMNGVGMMETLGFGTPWMGAWLALIGSWTILSGDWTLIRTAARKRAQELLTPPSADQPPDENRLSDTSGFRNETE